MAITPIQNVCPGSTTICSTEQEKQKLNTKLIVLGRMFLWSLNAIHRLEQTGKWYMIVTSDFRATRELTPLYLLVSSLDLSY